MNVKLISVSQPCFDEKIKTVDDLIVYCARVSNPSNQCNTETGPKLIRYLIDHKHWSPFEMASMCVEITTSRAIAQQILRHRSFSFQEFSQRYAEAVDMEPVEIRKQGATNRQGGEEVFDPTMQWSGFSASYHIKAILRLVEQIYKELLESGVAKESARFILPLCTQTRLYMHGTVRSWIHYLEQRLDSHAQKEHRLVAEQIKEIFTQQFPVIAAALW